VVVGGVSVFGSFCYLYVSHGFAARKANELNFAAVQPVVAALESYRGAHGVYPKSLCDLHLKEPPRFVDIAHLLYAASEKGSEYWLAIFPWREATIIMPSDEAMEYSSGDRKWTEIDVSDTKTKADEAWRTDCRADTMTNTR